MEAALNRNVLLRDLNEHITCFICAGYLIEATTIVDCLHTFCRSCLLKRLKAKQHNCPKCGNLIHHSHPLQYIGYDRTLQDVVNKLVPNLQTREFKRESDFYDMKGMKCPRLEEADVKTEVKDAVKCALVVLVTRSTHDHEKAQDCHRSGEQVQISLQRTDAKLDTMGKPYLVCSVDATIKILKKYVAKKIGMGSTQHAELDILCNDEILGKEHSLKFVLATRWRSKSQPLLLEYRPRAVLL